MKAIHNPCGLLSAPGCAVIPHKDNDNWKQFTTLATGGSEPEALWFLTKIMIIESNSQHEHDAYNIKECCDSSQR